MNNQKIIAISCLIVALAIGYYFVVYLPNKDRLLASAKVTPTIALATPTTIPTLTPTPVVIYRETTNSQKLTDCLNQAHQDYQQTGEAECKQLGYSDDQIKNLQCHLSADEIGLLEKQQTDAQNLCVSLYK